LPRLFNFVRRLTLRRPEEARNVVLNFFLSLLSDRIFTNYMQGLLETLGRSYSARYVEGADYRRRFGSMALGGLVSASLLFTSSAMTTIELCPLVAKSTLVSQMETSKTIGMVLALPSSDPAGLKAFVDHVSTPGDPLFRQFVTPQEFATRFG
jgi:Pro-kumamolisin, activation domain